MLLTATCAFGLESVVAREIQALGYSDTRTDNGSVSFEADALAVCRANLWLRSADRVWVTVGKFEASTFDQLFEGAKALPWSDLLPYDATFPVTGTSHNSTLTSVPACQGIVKKAVVESLKSRHNLSVFPETGALFSIRFQLVHDQCCLSLDSSGSGLHKRGYRQLTPEAPLRETLAAGMVQLSYWNAGRPLFDPFCGSGTLLIEAAMIGLSRAPGLRRSFAAEEWPGAAGLWAQARQEAEDRFDRTSQLELFGSDADAAVLGLARHNLAQAQLSERGIFLQQRPVSEFRSQRKHAVMITNPPYGERQLAPREAEQRYRELGRAVAPLDTWSIYILSSLPQVEQYLGKKAARKRKLYNGMLQCTYYQYPGPPPPREGVEPRRGK